jgi:plasmid stability protein
MASLTVRDIDDSELAGIAEDAKRNNRSLSAEVREMIADRNRQRRNQQAVSDFLAFTRKNPLTLPKGKTSLDLLREERDSW